MNSHVGSAPSNAPTPAISRLKARLFKARSTLVEANPFLGSLVMKLPVLITDDPALATACVTGSGICYFQSQFLEKLDVPATRLLLLHETLHLALDAFARCGTRNREKWNIAHDLAINQLIADSNQGGDLQHMPQAFKPLREEQYRGLSAEEIYDCLPDHTCDTALDLSMQEWQDLDKATQEALRREWQGKLLEAAEAAMQASQKDRDAVPAWAQKLLDPLLNPKIPWQTRLAQRVHGHLCGRRRTFARPDRRSSALHTTLPGPRKHRGAIGVFVDVSGSIGQHELGAFLSEMAGILKSLEIPVRLITWDVQVFEDLMMETAEDMLDYLRDRNFCLKGGGGTTPQCLIDYLQDPSPESLDYPEITFAVLLTDGYAPWPDPSDWPVDLLVVSTGIAPSGYENLHLDLG